MGRQALDAPRTNEFHPLPEQLVIVDDPNHWLYDPRVKTLPEKEFIDDIYNRGIVQTIIITKEEGEFLVVAGRKRVVAALIANKKRKKNNEELIRVPCSIRKGTKAELYEVCVAENTHRKDDTIYETVVKATRLMNLTGDIKRTSLALAKTPAQVQQLLKINELHEDVQKALFENKIGFVAALEFHDVSFDKQQEAIEKILRDIKDKPQEQEQEEQEEQEPKPKKRGRKKSTEKVHKGKKHPVVSAKKVKETLGKQSGVRGLKEIEERLNVKNLPPDYRLALLWVTYRENEV
jgi:ParB-like chromosome segregation protein Spo0J